MSMLKNGGWHSQGQFYAILEQRMDAQLVRNTVDADGDETTVEYEIRRPTATTTYAHKSSALRAWRRVQK